MCTAKCTDNRTKFKFNGTWLKNSDNLREEQAKLDWSKLGKLKRNQNFATKLFKLYRIGFERNWSHSGRIDGRDKSRRRVVGPT